MYKVQDKLKAYLDQYNYNHPKMDLILFNNAILHVARIARILISGHALLIGIGGTGRSI